MIHQQLLTVTLSREKIKIFLLINQTKQNGSTLAAELALYGPKINQEEQYPTYDHYQMENLYSIMLRLTILDIAHLPVRMLSAS